MAKIAISQYWTSYDDDTARDWIGATYSNVRQPTSGRTMENLAHGVNHLLCKTPRPMFGASHPAATTDTTGADPLYEWAYEDNVYNGTRYRITVVAVPRTGTNVGNSSIKQWTSSSLWDSEANGAESNATALDTVNTYYDAYYEEIDVTRNAACNARVVDGVSTFNGYTVLHVGVQERVLYKLDTDEHIYCDPTQAKKGGKILADSPEEIRSTFHDLRSTNLPIVMSYCVQGAAVRTHTNVTPANLFDTDIGARSADSPGSVVDVRYCARGTLDQRTQANVKVYCTIRGTLTAGDASPMNVHFIGPLDQTIISIAPDDSGWHGNTDHFIYLDANVAGTLETVGRNKIDVLASVNQTGDSFAWSAVRCWVDYE